MRLTWKLSLALALGVLLILIGYSGVRVRANVAGFRRDAQVGQRALALAVAGALESIAAREGEARAREILEAIAARAAPSRLDSTGVLAPASPSASGRSLRTAGPSGASRWIEWEPAADASEVVGVVSHVEERTDGVPLLRSTTAVRIPGRAPSLVRIVEPLVGEAEVEQEAMTRIANTSGIVLVLCVTLILGFGILFVGRPLEALRRQAQRVGRGERGLRTAIDSNDEIGDLAREMNAMAASLERAAERVEHEQEARLETLAQLRHVDRLRTIGELAASVAHDLGTPMGTVSARAQMIANGDVTPARARELAVSIGDEIERMSRSIRALLDHARADAPRLATTGARALAADAIALLAPLAASRHVALTLLDGDEVRASLDAARLRHVLVNLVTNAIDASGAGQSVEVRVATERGELRFEVADRGPGIPAERRGRVFEPFFTTKPEGEGTGLGLSIARGIAQEHGGTLSVAEREGGGTRFVLSIPVGIEGASPGGA